jgi:putative membrane protein
MMWWNGGHWYWGALMMVVFWAGVVALAYLAVRGGRSERRHRPTARELLDERFARGEITADEYAERKAVLEGRPVSP